MAQIVTNILTRFEVITQDEGLVRWPQVELIDWINEAYKQIVILRPDATATRMQVALAAGADQALDDAGSINLLTAYSLIKVVRNDNSSKRGIRLITASEIEDNIPDWYSETEVGDIERWMYDPDIPREFQVYPPALVGTLIQVIYAADPGEHTDGPSVGAEALKLKDYYAPMILDYVLYRAYSKDVDNVVNAKRAMMHYQAFSNGLGVKNTSDAAQSDKDN